MTFNEYLYLIRSDLHRYAGNSSFKNFLYHFIFEPGYKYTFWMRSCAFTSSKAVLRYLLFPLLWLNLGRLDRKYGITISYHTKIGPGFYIGHFGGIVVNKYAVIGKNCNISHQVTLGKANRGKRQGYPTIGDNVYIGPGAKIVGSVTVGDNAAIGANCVVTDDVPENAVVVGVPGRVISLDGSQGDINQTDYPTPTNR